MGLFDRFKIVNNVEIHNANEGNESPLPTGIKYIDDDIEVLTSERLQKDIELLRQKADELYRKELTENYIIMKQMAEELSNVPFHLEWYNYSSNKEVIYNKLDNVELTPSILSDNQDKNDIYYLEEIIRIYNKYKDICVFDFYLSRYPYNEQWRFKSNKQFEYKYIG